MKGEIFLGIISHVVDLQNFYAVTLEDVEKLDKATTYLEVNKLETIFWLPQDGERFLVKIPDGVFRARRTLSDRKDIMSFYLLDTGEEFQRPIKDMLNNTMYIMPEFLQEIQPIAFLCLRNFQKDADDTLLQNSLYEKFTFEALEVTDELVRVNMWKYEEGNIKDEIEEDSVDSQQLREILNNEEPVIFDAQIAVQGFHTQNDERRCKFYDPRTGGCWKKGRCRQLHIPDVDNGTFRDQKEIQFYDVNSPPQPKRNTLYPVKIISFTDLKNFTCHYLDFEETFYRGKTLKQLREKLDSGSYERLDELPAIGELVTAKIKGKFFRARILEEMDEFMTFPVFLIDEGTYNEKVSYENIYKYCTHLKDFPFFAISMAIADIDPLEENPRDTEAQNWILAAQQNAGPLQALIV